MKIAKKVTKLGTELVYDIFAKTKKLQAEGKKIIDLSLGQSVESPPEHVINATIKALKDGNIADVIIGYSSLTVVFKNSRIDYLSAVKNLKKLHTSEYKGVKKNTHYLGNTGVL
jgi:allophanate hydrolase subunit 1